MCQPPQASPANAMRYVEGSGTTLARRNPRLLPSFDVSIEVLEAFTAETGIEV